MLLHREEFVFDHVSVSKVVYIELYLRRDVSATRGYYHESNEITKRYI